MVGDVPLSECGDCFGLWTDSESFRRICADRERQSLLLGNVAQLESKSSAELTIRYLKCPRCLTLMNRVNFSKCSGVIIDVCRTHGVWFDANELHRIVQFIRTGGLELSRQKDKEEVAEQLRRLEWERRNRSLSSETSASQCHGYTLDASDIFSAAGALIDWFKKR
jgi:Zn-finger nucleic acid-binding protein